MNYSDHKSESFLNGFTTQQNQRTKVYLGVVGRKKSWRLLNYLWLAFISRQAIVNKFGHLNLQVDCLQITWTKNLTKNRTISKEFKLLVDFLGRDLFAQRMLFGFESPGQRGLLHIARILFGRTNLQILLQMLPGIDEIVYVGVQVEIVFAVLTKEPHAAKGSPHIILNHILLFNACNKV